MPSVTDPSINILLLCADDAVIFEEDEKVMSQGLDIWLNGVVSGQLKFMLRRVG